MNLLASYPIIVTDKVEECRAFHARFFGFETIFQASWIAVLGAGGKPILAFMDPSHPTTPPEPAAFKGEGGFLTLQVEDARAEHERITAAGLTLDLPLTEEPWGQRRFGVVDPAGMWVDVVEQVDPEAGWWERHG